MWLGRDSNDQVSLFQLILRHQKFPVTSPIFVYNLKSRDKKVMLLILTPVYGSVQNLSLDFNRSIWKWTKLPLCVLLKLSMSLSPRSFMLKHNADRKHI